MFKPALNQKANNALRGVCKLGTPGTYHKTIALVEPDSGERIPVEYTVKTGQDPVRRLAEVMIDGLGMAGSVDVDAAVEPISAKVRA